MTHLPQNDLKDLYDFLESARVKSIFTCLKLSGEHQPYVLYLTASSADRDACEQPRVLGGHHVVGVEVVFAVVVSFVVVVLLVLALVLFGLLLLPLLLGLLSHLTGNDAQRLS